MDKDYWIDTVSKLTDPATACAAAHVISTGLGYGNDLDHTNLGEALKHVPREELIWATLHAYQDKLAHPYCNLILWHFEPREIVTIYKRIKNPDKNVREGVKRFLEDTESALAEEI